MRFTSIIYKSIIGFYKILPLKKYICFIIRKFGFPKKFYLDLRFSGIFKVRFQNKEFKLRNYIYTTVENEIFWKGIENGWEKVSLNLWIEMSKRSDVIFDIGANTGIYSLVAKTINPKADVYAFEPSERVYVKLKENNKLNNNEIITEKIALSNSNGLKCFYDIFSDHQYSASLSMEIKTALSSRNVKLNEYYVQTKTLRSYIEENKINKIDLIKLDVEYHECEVIEGLGSYLDKYKPAFIIEILTDELAKKIEPYFKNKGYLYYSIDEENAPKLLKSLEKSSYLNFLICQEIIAWNLQL